MGVKSGNEQKYQQSEALSAISEALKGAVEALVEFLCSILRSRFPRGPLKYFLGHFPAANEAAIEILSSSFVAVIVLWDPCAINHKMLC